MLSVLFYLLAAYSLVPSAMAFQALGRSIPDDQPAKPSPGEVQMILGPQLSPQAMLFFPGSQGYHNATSRWNSYAAPNISVVVEPATADDISATIRYANDKNLPFIAINRGHGNSDTLANVHQGIEIWMNQFTDIQIAEDGSSARFGGGTYAAIAAEKLDSIGKIGATGSCACVGLMGAGLGAGHGRAQGLHGLVLDNLLSVDMVLWNGTQLQVSNTSHSDLWWGIRGAGHNFGIVTSFTARIYDRPSPTWYYGNLAFHLSHLEAIFDIFNQQHEQGVPPEMGYRGVLLTWNTTLDASAPILEVEIEYGGPASDIERYKAPFLALGPLAVRESEQSYPDIFPASSTGLDDPFCQHGLQNMMHGLYVEEFNTTAIRTAIDYFVDQSKDNSVFVDGAHMIFEAYALQGVKAVQSDSTAFAHRHVNYLITHIVTYEVGTAPNDDVIKWGQRTRNIIHEGQPAGSTYDTYVNYAFGDESLESMYGYEPWRLERLRALKASYDPFGKFNFYNGITAS